MLSSRRDIRFPALGIRYADHALLHSRFRVHLQRREGCIDDQRLLQRSFRPRRLGKERSNLILLLSGRARLCTEEGVEEIAAGEWVGVRRSSNWVLRREEASTALVLEWEAGSLGTRLVESGVRGRLGPTDFAELRRLAAPLAEEVEPERASSALAGILDSFRAEGLPFDRHGPSDLLEEVPEEFVALQRAVDRLLEQLHRQPMLSDLEAALDRSRPTLLGNLRRYHERYAYNAPGGWRDLLQRWRFTVATCLMSHPDVKTEDAAQLLGYGSPPTFCRALAQRGLPSPGALREVLRGMG